MNTNPRTEPKRTIWKFPLEITDEQHVDLPHDALILTAQFQGQQLCLWALVAPGEPMEASIIHIVGTGDPMPDGEHSFIATVQHPVMPLVWHVFEEVADVR